MAAASAIDLLRGAASGHKKTRFAHSSGRSRALMFTAALAAASGAYKTLPENVTRVNYSGRRADCNAQPHASWFAVACAQRCECRENSRARISPRRGEPLPRFQETEMSNPLLVDSGTGLRRPALLRLSHECTARSPGRRTQKERIRPNRVCRIVASSRIGSFGLLGPFQAGMMPN